MITSRQCVEALSSRLARELRKVIKSGDSYAILDFPDHSNVGDSAIWVGQLDVLRDITGRRPDYVCKIEDYSASEVQTVAREGVIFIHGGGNFGDIWPHHQKFRHRVLTDFPNARIVQLPQTIHYKGDGNANVCASVIAAHKNFHLFVRDYASEAFAERHFDCEITLCPDAAFGIGNIDRPQPPSTKLVGLFRTDHETSDADYRQLISKFNISEMDWLAEPKLPWKSMRRQAWLSSIAAGRLSRRHVRVSMYETLARHRVERGLRMLAAGELVVTDRLHAHILCILMDLPHVALDNSYGKISGFHKAWLKGVAGADLCASVEDADRILSKLMHR